ncbi:MAG: PLP-dependent aminotransferase family protein [Alphaproteobacteria bacterium]
MAFDFERRLARAAPAPAPTWSGFAPYNFIGGHNDSASLPSDGLAEAAVAVLRDRGRDLSYYSIGDGPRGVRSLRREVAQRLARHRGATVDADSVLITTGSHEGLDLINRVLLNPGDTVIVEQHCYEGALNGLRAAGAWIVAAPLDQDGLNMAALAGLLERMQSDGTRPRFLYTIPTVQNPTGSVLPLDRRHELLRLAAAHDLAIVEDECYADLLWQGDGPPSLLGLDSDGRVIHVGSFSKNLAPALRLGYAIAPPAVLSRMTSAKGGGSGALEQLVVAEYFAGHFTGHRDRLRQALKRKCDVMLECLAESFGTAADVHRPPGGIYVWVRLPEAVDAERLFAAAMAEGVAINPGPRWSADPDSATHHIRLCFAAPTEQEMRDGIARLAAICQREFGVPATSANVRG